MPPGIPLRLALYNFLLILGAVLLSPWVLFQVLFVPRRRTGWRERLGAAPSFAKASAGPVWVHAVSVGEVRAASPMLAILARHLAGERAVVLSTVTVTGQETARRECPEAERIFFFPLDLAVSVRRALSRVRPASFVTAETEIWPNFLAACFRRGIPVAVVNGRISDRSFARYRRFAWFFRPFFANIALFLMQSEEDARRVRSLGVPADRIRVTGNAKYDRSPAEVAAPAAIEAWAGSGFLLTAGSTHRGEEEAVLDLLGREDLLERGLMVALAPRHPERFEEVASLLRARGIPFARWSAAGRPGGLVEGRVLLVDAMGVLDGLYPLSAFAFVGGSLIPVGGHNLLEPAMHGVPVLTGPHTENFRDIAASLTESGGATVVGDARDLAAQVGLLLDAPALRSLRGEAARTASESARGASERNAEGILSLLPRGGR